MKENYIQPSKNQMKYLSARVKEISIQIKKKLNDKATKVYKICVFLEQDIYYSYCKISNQRWDYQQYYGS
jgi:hypothetical protein